MSISLLNGWMPEEENNDSALWRVYRKEYIVSSVDVNFPVDNLDGGESCGRVCGMKN